MRSSSLSLALGLVALGVLATTPGSAKAYWPASLIGLRSASGHGAGNVVGLPSARVPSNGVGATKAVYSPGAYRGTATPNSGSRLWFGSSSTTANSNPITGQAMQSGSPSVTANVFSPYAGIRSANVQSSSSVSNGSLFRTNTSFTSGLVSLTGSYSPSFSNTSPPLSPYATYIYQVWNPNLMAWASAYRSDVTTDGMAGSRPIFTPNYLTPNYMTPNLLSGLNLVTPNLLSGSNLLTPSFLK
jgi:hypothetical protein